MSYFAVYKLLKHPSNSAGVGDIVDYENELATPDQCPLTILKSHLPNSMNEIVFNNCIERELVKLSFETGATTFIIGHEDSAEYTAGLIDRAYYVFLYQDIESSGSEGLCIVLIHPEDITIFHEALLNCLTTLTIPSENKLDLLLHTLENWEDKGIHFLHRVCDMYSVKEIAVLIYASLIGLSIRFHGVDIDNTTPICHDLMNFASSCRLDKPLLEKSDKNVVNIELNKQFEIENIEPEPKPSQFCVEWAEQLIVTKQDSFSSKRMIDNYRLRVVKDLNTLKRLITQAENDFYSLYEAFKFVQNSGNSNVLLDNILIHCDKPEVVHDIQRFMLQIGARQ